MEHIKVQTSYLVTGVQTDSKVHFWAGAIAYKVIRKMQICTEQKLKHTFINIQGKEEEGKKLEVHNVSK